MASAGLDFCRFEFLSQAIHIRRQASGYHSEDGYTDECKRYDYNRYHKQLHHAFAHH
jgi:hypothetical protein